MKYEKKWLSFYDQLKLLIERGMAVERSSKAIDFLARVGYYRLSGYWHAFKERSGLLVRLENGGKPKKIKEETIVLDVFKGGATFKNAIDLYIFDKKLRLLTMDALERIEISLRVDIAHGLGQKDPFAYLDKDYFHLDFSGKLDKSSGVSNYHNWLSKHAQLISRSKEDFVSHNRSKYGLPLSIWVACEVWDFGTLSRLFSGMKSEEQDLIASKYGVANGRIFASWLHSFNYLRNVCAHHSRLWNRNIVVQPKLPPLSDLPWVSYFENDNHAKARCFLLLCMLECVLKGINPSSSWSTRMVGLLNSFPNLNHLGLNLEGMGLPKGCVLGVNSLLK